MNPTNYQPVGKCETSEFEKAAFCVETNPQKIESFSKIYNYPGYRAYKAHSNPDNEVITLIMVEAMDCWDPIVIEIKISQQLGGNLLEQRRTYNHKGDFNISSGIGEKSLFDDPSFEHFEMRLKKLVAEKLLRYRKGKTI